jgi:hypothetical protein
MRLRLKIGAIERHGYYADIEKSRIIHVLKKRYRGRKGRCFRELFIVILED